jgi:hypothetical protein
LITGYDPDRDEVLYNEPAEDNGANRRMPRARLLALWPLKYDTQRWTVVRLPLDASPRSKPTFHEPAKNAKLASPATYAQRVMTLRERLPRGFSFTVEPPFVVAGNERPEMVTAHAQNTVRWARDHLRAELFDTLPARPLDVLLFHDAQSYETIATALFGEAPTTPYGYYLASQDALVMNIATGGGTLVHELVHPFVEADFPDAPPWLNEGLGSLYEQSAERDGHIVGLVNWRLKGLKSAIAHHALPTFQKLAAMDAHAFYDEDRGDNYAQARYLMLYLQENGALARFYKDARDHRRDDPTGYAALVRTLTGLGERDMTAFQDRWQSWASNLKSPR